MLFTGYQISIDPSGWFGLILSYVYLFFIGGFIGWITEILFRRFVSMKRWINPGFLTGPCLPLYGFGVCALHFICRICFRYMLDPTDPMATNSFYQITEYDANGNSTVLSPSGSLPFWAVTLICVLIIGVAMTLIEFLAGLIFIKGFKVRLWDYSKMKGNILGLICPVFSAIWAVVGVLYWFALRPLVNRLLYKMIPHMRGATFFLGAFVAIFIIDLIHSIMMTIDIKKEAEKVKQIVDFEKFKHNFKIEHKKNAKVESIKASIKESLTPLNDKLHKVAYRVKSSMYIDNKIPEKNQSETPRTKKKE